MEYEPAAVRYMESRQGTIVREDLDMEHYSHFTV